jgi:hypothetical protein
MQIEMLVARWIGGRLWVGEMKKEVFGAVMGEWK